MVTYSVYRGRHFAYMIRTELGGAQNLPSCQQSSRTRPGTRRKPSSLIRLDHRLLFPPATECLNQFHRRYHFVYPERHVGLLIPE